MGALGGRPVVLGLELFAALHHLPHDAVLLFFFFPEQAAQSHETSRSKSSIANEEQVSTETGCSHSTSIRNRLLP
jgi:hypothetical protein